MHIWITGGAGFLGNRLTKRLRTGNHIVSLSRRNSELAQQSISIDLSKDKETLSKLIAKEGAPEVVVHAASRQPGPYEFQEFVRSNVRATENLLDSLKSSPPRLIIFTSTQSVYAQSKQLPFTELHPASSPTPYAATKRWAEELMATFREAQVVVLRLPSLYGVGQGDSFIDGLAKLALANEPIELFSRGELIRDALHVSDVIKAVETCISRPLQSQFSLLNLGCGRAIKSREWAEALVEALESESEIITSDRPTNQLDGYADIELAKTQIGFQPTELRESMQNYANELRA